MAASFHHDSSLDLLPNPKLQHPARAESLPTPSDCQTFRVLGSGFTVDLPLGLTLTAPGDPLS